MDNLNITRSTIEEIFDNTPLTEFHIKEVTTTDVYSTNIHEILSLLIQDAGRLCDNYASDLIYHIDDIREAIRNSCINETFIVAIRGNGVDNIDDLINNMNHERWSDDKYRRIYGIRIIHNSNPCTTAVDIELRDIKSQINSYMWRLSPWS